MLNARAWNVLLRTAHIAAMGVLLGGYAFSVVPRDRLLPSLLLTVGTGVALGMLEAGMHLLWFHQGRGLITLAKLGLLCAIPLFEDYSFHILLVVVVIASIGSHMRARLRYYSLIYREVVYCHGGPGAGRLAAEIREEENAPEDE